MISAGQTLGGPVYDPQIRDHFWAVLKAYRFSGNPKVQAPMDESALAEVRGPGCLFCGMLWNPHRADTPCPGNLRG